MNVRDRYDPTIPACVLRHRRTCGIFNPNANPRFVRPLRIIKYLAVPRSLVSYCKYLLFPPVTAEVASSSLVVPAIYFQTLTENPLSQRRHKKGPKRHNLNSAENSSLPTLHCHPRLSDSQHFGPVRLPCFPSWPEKARPLQFVPHASQCSPLGCTCPA